MWTCTSSSLASATTSAGPFGNEPITLSCWTNASTESTRCYEGMPIALMEAMRAGLCCIASDLAGVRALFGSPLAGLVAGSDDSLIESLRSALGDRSRIDHLGALAQRRYEDAFTADAMMTATRAVQVEPIRP